MRRFPGIVGKSAQIQLDDEDYRETGQVLCRQDIPHADSEIERLFIIEGTTKMGKQTYTEEFKQEMAKVSFQTNTTLGAFTQDLSINRSSLSRWRKEYGPDGTLPVNRKTITPAVDPAKVRRLQKALCIAKQERDILRKVLPSLRLRSVQASRKPRNEVSIH